MHVMAEAMRLAYADRSKYLGDPDYIDLPVAALTSKEYAKRLAYGISLSRARPSADVGPGDLSPYESPETTHYSILDKDGNALANTYTLMFSYGSGVVIDGTGILLLNVLEHGMNIADATSAPRIHHQWYPDRLQLESGFSPDAIRLLRARGHDVQFSAGMGSLQTVFFADGVYYGYADPRRPGALAVGK